MEGLFSLKEVVAYATSSKMMEQTTRNLLLKKAREHQGWTQDRLAQLMEVDTQTIRAWERGKNTPLLENRHRLCQLFQLSPAELGLESERDPASSPQLSLSPNLSEGEPPSQEVVPVFPVAVSAPLLESKSKKRRNDNRRRMLNRVNAIWVKGVLGHSLRHATLMALDLRDRPDALLNPWHWSKLETDYFPESLPPEMTLLEVFDDANGELLLLGEAGAGKTTALLTLVRDLLERAFQDEDQAIPVVFALSEWANKKMPLDEWFVEELSSKYRLPTKVAQDWIHTNHLFLLLDGLDEMPEAARPECVTAINAYRQEHDFPPVVISCRREEYFAQSKRFGLQRAIQLEPLTPPQIDTYLAQAGPKLEGVRKALSADAELREMITTPLLLYILMLAYQENVQDALRTGSLEDRRKYLFAAYFTRMLQRGRADRRYSEAEVKRWLSWLARRLAERNQTEFYIERMQPDWLPNDQGQRRYQNMVIRCIFGLDVAAESAALACFRGDSFPNKPGLFAWLGGGMGNHLLGWMTPGLGIGLQGASSLWIIVILALALIVFLVSGGKMPTITLSGVRRGLLYGFRNGAFVGAPVAIFASLVLMGQQGWYGIYRGIGMGFYNGLLMLLASLLIVMIKGEQSIPSLKAKGKRSSLTFSDRLVNCLIFTIIGMVSFGGIYCWQAGEVNALFLAYTIIMGFCQGLFFGSGIVDAKYLLGFGPDTQIKPAEVVRWSGAWKQVPDIARKGLFLGALIMGMVMVVLGGISSLVYGSVYGLRYGLIYGAIVGAAASVTSILTSILSEGWSSSMITDRRQLQRPNEGIRRSLSHAVLAACLFGLMGGVMSGIACGLIFGLIGGLSGWPILGAGFGIVLGGLIACQFFIFSGGMAFIEHFFLRYYLWRRGVIPRNYATFLNYATDRILLRKIGGGYMFVHRLLLDYFAGLEQ